MKILFVGTLISKEMMEQLNRIGRKKASVAPNNYETMFVKGLVENGAEVEVLSIPAVAAFPGSPEIAFNGKSERLSFGIIANYIPFINIQGLKQISIQWNTYKLVNQWLIKNSNCNDKCVISFSVYPPYSNPLVHLCKKYSCHLSAVITDLPEYMYTWGKDNPISAFFGNLMKNKMIALQDKFDSYILFTKLMAKRMKIDDKPFLVSEGLIDEDIFKGISASEKETAEYIVYAGNLSRLYGIHSLLDGFMQTKCNLELHLFGSGEDVNYIKDCAKKDKRIKYKGRVTREETLTALMEAHLIVINKPTSDDYSNYSFSSKILECMSSGTPILTTRVGGMPEEYYPYFYFIDDESVSGIANSIESVASLNNESLKLMGERAREFALEKKNYYQQTKLILSFLEQSLGS